MGICFDIVVSMILFAMRVERLDWMAAARAGRASVAAAVPVAIPSSTLAAVAAVGGAVPQ